MNLKKFTAVLLSAAIGLSSCISVFADENSVKIYDENQITTSEEATPLFTIFDTMPVDSNVVGEDIVISTVTDLENFRERILSGDLTAIYANVTLENNLDLSDIDWIPIGANKDYIYTDASQNKRYLYAFRGNFDGKGHTISNLTITSPEYETVGLFGTALYAKFSNINLTGVNIDVDNTDSASGKITEFAGALCGDAAETSFNNCTVEGSVSVVNVTQSASNSTIQPTGLLIGGGCVSLVDCYAKGKLSVNTAIGSITGGIVGYLYTVLDNDILQLSHAENLKSDVNIDVTVNSTANSYAGGIIGYAQVDSISNSKCGNVSVNMTLNQLAPNYIGGIVAAVNKGTVYDCDSSARMTASHSSQSVIGGIVGLLGIQYTQSNPGLLSNTVSVNNCRFNEDGSIKDILNATPTKSIMASIGGIAGLCQQNSSISNCTSYSSNISWTGNSDVIPNSSVRVGGIAGTVFGGNIKYCVSRSDIKCDYSVNTINAGGIVGTIVQLSAYSFYIDNEKTELKNIILGSSIDSCTSYSNIDVSGGMLYAGGIIGLSNAANGSKVVQFYDFSPYIKTCSAYGNIKGTINVPTGITLKSPIGMVGDAIGYSVDTAITNCASYGTPSLSIAEGTTSNNAYVGDFIGRVKELQSITADESGNIPGVPSIITNCYSYGKAVYDSDSTVKYNGFTSELSPTTSGDTYPDLNNCFFLSKNPENESNVAKGFATPLTATQLADANSYDNWDFVNTWKIKDNKAVLVFEDTDVCKLTFDSDSLAIKQIVISQPKANSKLYVAVYGSLFAQSDTPTTLKVYDLDNYMGLNSNAAVIDCDIPTDGSEKILAYIWDDSMKPLADAKSLASLTPIAKY